MQKCAGAKKMAEMAGLKKRWAKLPEAKTPQCKGENLPETFWGGNVLGPNVPGASVCLGRNAAGPKRPRVKTLSSGPK